MKKKRVEQKKNREKRMNKGINKIRLQRKERKMENNGKMKQRKLNIRKE